MRRIFCAVLIVLLVLPAAAMTHAQEGKFLLPDLDATFSVTDLGFEFNYPTGWLTDTSSGITMAGTEADLAAAIDDDDTTHPQGYTISLQAAPLDILELKEPNLDNAAAAVTKLANVTVSEQSEIGLMARRALVLVGIDDKSEAGLATVWVQGSFLVVFSLGVPGAEVTFDDGFTWGRLLSTVLPITPIDLTETATVNKGSGFTINYPTGWLTGDDPNLGAYFFEIKADLETALANSGNPGTLAGAVVLIESFGLADLGLTADNTLDDIVAILIQSGFMTDPVNRNEYIITNTPALSVEYTDPQTGNQNLILFSILGDQVIAVFVAAPDAEGLEAFRPTLSGMLMTITPVE